jgi:hypothetical protein
MDLLLIIFLMTGTFALLLGMTRSQPPQIIYVQTVTPEPARRGPGCLLWLIGILVLLVALGIIRL